MALVAQAGLLYTPWIALAAVALGLSSALGAAERKLGLSRLHYGLFLFGTPVQKALKLSRWSAMSSPLPNFVVALAVSAPAALALNAACRPVCAALLGGGGAGNGGGGGIAGERKTHAKEQ